jgi:hypothetical protein
MFDYQEQARNCGIGDYYEFRKTIRTIYQHDTYYGDLTGKLWSIKDICTFVQSMEVSGDTIIIVCDEDTTAEVTSGLSSYVRGAISQYLEKALPLAVSNKEELNNYLNYLHIDNYPLFDISIMGNVIKYVL